MNTYQKASEFRRHLIAFAATLRAEGNDFEADIFDEMCACSDEGLSAMYDALKGSDDT
jgi:hypothetical protein